MQDGFTAFGILVGYVWLTVWGWHELVRGHVARGGPRCRGHLIALFAAHVPAVIFLCAAAISSSKEPSVALTLGLWLCAVGACWIYHWYGQGAKTVSAFAVESEGPRVATPLRERMRAWWRQVNDVPGDVRKMAPPDPAAPAHDAGTSASNATGAQLHLGTAPRINRSTRPAGDRSAETYPPASIDPIQLPDTISFRYRKADRAERRRTVTVYQAVDAAGKPYVDAHDHDRKATRSFRLDRIVGGVTRLETGEVMSAMSWFSAVAASPDSARWRTTTGRMAKACDWQTSVIFAGLHPARRYALEERALAVGWDVRERFTKSVDYVVAGPMIGHKQRARAEVLGIRVVDEDTALALMMAETMDVDLRIVE